MLRIAHLLLAIVIYYLPIVNADNQKFFVLTGLLCVFVSLELILEYKKDGHFFFISPIFLSMVIVFGLVFGGITNFILVWEGKYIIKGFGYKLFNEREWLVKTMFVANIAALATWIGYSSKLGQKLYDKVLSLGIYKKIYSSAISERRLVAVAIIAYITKFYLFSIGLYGRIVDEQYFEAGTGFKAGSQIRILGDLSYVTFLFISINKFKMPNAKNNFIFFISLALEMFFGFIYGARGPFITPFLIMLLANYYVTQKIRLINVAILIGAIYLAFTVVLEFKSFVLSKGFSRTSSTKELVQNFAERQSRYVNKDNQIYDVNEALDATLISVNFVPEAGVAIRQRDKIGMDHLEYPNIIKTVFLFPVDAFVPRFIQGENEFPWGYWFKEEVIEMNRGLRYSIAMSPIGFLYLGGGLTLVIIGFWFYGLLLRFSFPFLKKDNPFSILVYLLIASALFNLDSIYSNTLIYVTRYVLIYPIIFWIIFDPKVFRTR